MLSAAQFLVALDFSIVNVALPEIQEALSLSTSDAQWIITGYSVTFGGLLLVGGRMADVYGRRRVFVVGLAVLAIGSAVGGIAPSAPLLIAARALQGTGAALAAPAGLSLISTLFEEGPERNRAMGVYGAVMSTGFVTGVTTGGVLTSLLGWRSVMFASLLAAAGLLLAAVWVLPQVIPSVTGRRLHVTAGLSATGCIMAFVYAVSRAPVAGWNSLEVGGFLLAAVCLAGVFVVAERRSKAPLAPVWVVRRPTIAAGSAVAALAGSSAAGVVFVLALYSEGVLHYSPAQTGLLFMAFGCAAVIAGMLAHLVLGAVSLANTVTSAMFVQTAGTSILVLISVEGNLLIIVVGMSLVGFGHVGTIVACATLATSDLAESEHGVASGVLNAALEIGSGVGAALLATVAAVKLDKPPSGIPTASEMVLTEAYRYALFAGVALASLGVSICVAALATRSWHPPREAQRSRA